MAEKFTECFIRGIIPLNLINDFILVLKSYSCPHLNNLFIFTKDYEYFSSQSRVIIFQRDEYLINIETFSIDIFTNQTILEELQQSKPVRYLYQEGRSTMNSATVRSRRQSVVVGDLDKFLKNFDCIVRNKWEFYSLQIELLGGIKVSILKPKQSSNSSGLYVVEIKCASSEANASLAAEKITAMSATLSPWVQYNTENS